LRLQGHTTAETACSRCSAQLPTDALVCRFCHTLVYAVELEHLSSSAKSFEESRDFLKAEHQWLIALPKVPPDSKQALWIQEHVQQLRTTGSASGRSKWLQRLAPLAPIVLGLSKGKALLALFNAKFLLSFGAFLGVYWSLYGLVFAAGLAVQVLVHEMGHYIDIRRRGLPADMPLFLPGLGAFVRWNALGVSLETRAGVSLAGPLAGLIASAICAAMWFATGNGVWGAVSRSGAWLNLLNLIPMFGLDGGHAFLALTRRQRGIVLVLSLVLFLLVGDAVLFLITLGAGWRMFTKDYPSQPSALTEGYFAVVLCALAGLVWLLPGHGFGTP
jgi:Zn-dependent protease